MAEFKNVNRASTTGPWLPGAMYDKNETLGTVPQPAQTRPLVGNN